MADNHALYRLMSWLSPSYPVGAFSYSHGLENSVESGRVGDVDQTVDWVTTVLLLGTGRVDGVLFREAYQATEVQDWVRLDEVVVLGNAFQATAEFALESRAQGDAFVKATLAAWPTDALRRIEGGAIYPVAVAVASASHNIPVDTGLHAYFHAFAANLVSAAVRLVPLGQTDGQLAMSSLADVVARAERQSIENPFDDLGAAAPLMDHSSMQHETQYSRLFRS